MTANLGLSEVENPNIDPAIVAGSVPPLCSRCGTRPRFKKGKRWDSYCRECENERKRIKYANEKSNLKRGPTWCIHCRQRLPHQRNCSKKQIERGRTILNQYWPGYGDVITDEAFLVRVSKNSDLSIRLPLPSVVFPGLSPRLDERLKREKRDKDVSLCQALATVPQHDQGEFLELYLVNPTDAQRWHQLPRWKRPIRHGDKDDQQVWKFFVMQRLNMELTAQGKAWSMVSQGAQLPQMFGTIANLSAAGIQKLVAVLSMFGSQLQNGHDVGDMTKAPWL